MASLSQSTLKQYNSVYKIWSNFCNVQKEDPFNPKKGPVITFLVERFKEGACYGTLNTSRSALSLISDSKIGEDKEISRLLLGFYKQRPTAPKYAVTWDVSIVLKYLDFLYVEGKTDFQMLTKRTITLVSLSTGQRAQTLTKIKLSNIVQITTGLEIKIDECIKTSRPGRAQPMLKIPFFMENPSRCVAKALLNYIDVTKDLRKKNEYLFIAYKKPHNAVGAQTINR